MALDRNKREGSITRDEDVLDAWFSSALSNEKFVANAPEEIVEEEKGKTRSRRGAQGKILDAPERLKKVF